MGSIELPVTLGDYPVSITKMMEFLMVDLPSVYNVLLERPALVGLGAVSSVRHLAIKFSTSSGIGTLKGDQLWKGMLQHFLKRKETDKCTSTCRCSE